MKKIKGFTLAEVLLTLAVIGIVAAIILPSLLVDTTEKAFDAQKRALHARLAQAIGMMSGLSGYGQYAAETKEGAGDGKDNAAETFLYEGLSKVYKMNNICDSDNLDRCGIPSSIITMAGENMVFPKKLSELNDKLIVTKELVEQIPETYFNNDITETDTKVAAFETINGESVAVFYKPDCRGNSGGTENPYNWGVETPMQLRMCVNFIYDLNGLKGPNKVGRDIGFITAFYNKNSEVVAPIPFDKDLDKKYKLNDAINQCNSYADDARLPNKDEAASLFVNKNLIDVKENSSIWSSSPYTTERGYAQNIFYGHNSTPFKNWSLAVRCIKK